MLISLLLPFLVLFLIEICLRAFHYGHDLKLFIEYPGDSNFLVLNPDASRKYFANQENATTGNLELFRKKKAENTQRIFVLGESTAIGYPYFHNGSFHRWLQYRLMHEYPDRNFEIINIALTAVNSYTVSGFAKEVVNYEPDAILIYTGHNEYYGAMGVGSTDRTVGNAMIINLLLKLRQFRLMQLLTNVYERIVRSFGSRNTMAGKTRMEAMVADQQIPYGSKLFNRGIDQFRSNMEETLLLLEKQQIPVFFSNLVSNEKDLRPFVSLPTDSLQISGFVKNYALGLAALENKDPVKADSSFKEANHAYNSHALCNYYLGRLAYKQEDYVHAKMYFSKAKDLDALRFRAPDTINTIIAQLCHKYKKAHLVDTRAAFEAGSPNGIIGDELLIEHVHPNLTGYALLSDVFYETMKRQGLFSVPKEKEISFRQLLQDMPITKTDSLTGVYKVFNLKRSWPFRDESSGSGQSQDLVSPAGTLRDSLNPGTMEERMAHGLALKQRSWPDAMDSLYNYYIGRRDLLDARKVVETLVLEHPTEEPYYDKAADLCGALKDDDNALFYFKKSFSLSPSFEKARKIFVLYFKLDKPANAIPYLDYAIHNNASGFNLAPVRQIAAEILQLQKAFGKDTADLLVLNQIADKYFKMGNREGAAKYIEKVLKADRGNKIALALLSRFKKT
jgi:tetratricopeptide (TPR) repeat protein